MLKKNIESLKVSNYNYFILEGKDSVIGYNFLYRTIIRMSLENFIEVDKFISKLNNDGYILSFDDSLTVFPEIIESLREAKFLIDKDLDELALIKFRYNKSLFDSNSLSLVILPTLWCNLDCPYCFEYKKPVFMSNEVEEALFKWITSFNYKRFINISWFGGEPLLNKDLIIRLTKRIQEFCSSINATYSASITTNGYFLDSEFQSIIPSLGIKHIQITLDGDKEDHDKLRKQRNGEGSFEQIFKNIVSFCEKTTDCDLSIRVNCSNENYEGAKQLINRFPPIVKSKADIFFRWIWSNEASGYQDFSSAARGDKPFNGLYDLYNKSSSSGWLTGNPNNNSDINGYCEVDCLDHFSIDPEGNIYLCTHTFNSSDAIGSVLDSIIKKENKYAKWYSVNPFDDDVCVNCKLLPTCCGGCREARYSGHRECIEEKGNISLFVKNIVDERILQKNRLQCSDSFSID